MRESELPIAMGDDRTTIVCCVERGQLETQTLLMLEMLRRWGGPLGQSRVLVVMPRRGGRPARETVKALESLGAELHDGSHLNRIPWYKWYAKVVAAQVAEREATTPVITWLDSDVLIFGPLVELGLPHGDDFTARREWLSPMVKTSRTRRRYFCRFAFEAVGLDLDRSAWLPDLVPPLEETLDSNAGVYAFRRGLGFSETYADFTQRLLRAHVFDGYTSFWYNEQTAVALAMLSLKMRLRELSMAENHFAFFPYYQHPEYSVEEARLVHYSDRLFPENWPGFMERIRLERPEFHEWLRARGPILRSPNSWRPRDVAHGVHRWARVLLQRGRSKWKTKAWLAARRAADEAKAA